MTPRVSVIVPAYRAHDSLGRALASVADCGWPADAVEIVIAPDDGTDYGAFADGFGRRVVLPPGPVASGAGPARNRALAAATGAAVAFLDADDTWEAGYLRDLVPLALNHGAAFGRTSILAGGREILRLPDTDHLTFDAFGRFGASFHPVLPRERAGPFANLPAQDVLHAVEVLALAGGRAPLGAAAYRIHLHSASETARGDFAARAARAYSAHAAAILAGRVRVPETLRAAAAQVFADKAALNAAHAAAPPGQGFYEFVAARLDGAASA